MHCAYGQCAGDGAGRAGQLNSAAGNLIVVGFEDSRDRLDGDRI